MMNQPSEDYPNFFPNVIPPPPGFFAIPPPPDFSTIVPPTKKPKSNGALIALVIVIVLAIGIALFFLYKWWKKEVKESQQQVEKHEPNRVRLSKNDRKSNVHERDMVYRYDMRLSKSNGRLMEARYGKKPKKNYYYYEGDLESGFDDMYLTSGDESKFYSEKLVIDAKDVRKSNAYKGEENTYSKPETTHNGQTKEESAEDAAISYDIERSIKSICGTKSNAYKGEEDVHSETETIHDRHSERELAKGSMRSDAPERELAKGSMRSDAPESHLESALGETGPSKSKHETVRGKHKKGKVRAG